MSRKTALIIVFSIFFIFIIMSILTVSFLKTPLKVSVKSGSYLVLPIYGDIPEYSTQKFIFRNKEPLTIWGIFKTVQRAKYDKRIKGIILRIYSPSAGMGKIDEIIDILKDFKSTGKKVYAYLEFSGMKDYYLASVADKIYMIPTGTLMINGYSFEIMFYKDFFSKLGIKADFLHIGKYKTASNLFTENKMTPAHREVMQDLLNEYTNRFLTVVSINRNIKLDDAKQLFNIGLFTPKEAMNFNLVDKIGYYDELIQDLSNKISKLIINKKVNTINYFNYIYNLSYPKKSNNIAIIFAMGQIDSGKSGYNPLFGTMMGSDTIINSIKKARKNRSVKAIVLRINSPGGSGIASDEILRELKKTAKEKPIIVSMSDLAASGGYWISMAGKEIIAHPLTLTGSIGVLAGKFCLKGLYDKLGLTIDRVEEGKYAHMFSSTEEFSDDEKQLFFKNIKTFYDNFLNVVSEGRKMKKSDVDSIGRGRVWTGNEALKINLIDRLGGLLTALNEAKKISKLKNYGIIVYPSKKTIFSELGINADIFSYIKSVKKIKTIVPYKNYEPLTLMEFIPELSDN